jgi:HlyD family secretion protein
MYPRNLLGVPLAFAALVAGSLLLPSATAPFPGKLLLPTAHAEGVVRNLLDRLRGKTMPDGIFKTNGRLEATQVDVAAKYPGRLIDINVEEGSEVKTGQVVGRVSSPEYEAQLQAAQSNVRRAEETMAKRKRSLTSAKPCWPRPSPISSAGRNSSANKSSRNRRSTSAAAITKAPRPKLPAR